MTVERRKLIEVSLPLEAINREAAREKSIRRGHPSTLHLWWARRPLAAARAVLFAQLVDDPSSHPERYPTAAAQQHRREELHALIEKLVVWENSNNSDILAEAHKEILDSTGGNPPTVLDPFAGGGTIPLEAQRLGLNARASDLNPVAVLINKALIEIPPKFRNKKPVFAGLADSQIRTWKDAAGLAADVRAYGQWLRDEAEKRIGHLYPKATLSDGSKAPVIAWIWARTVKCPNPRCGIHMPLVRSWWLGTKKGREAYVIPTVDRKVVSYHVHHDARKAPPATDDATVGRSGAICINCRTAVELSYIRSEGSAGRLGADLLAIVAESNRQRVYTSPSLDQYAAAHIDRPAEGPDGMLSTHSQYMGVPRYGLRKFSDLFTSRQLVSLTTLTALIGEARNHVFRDCVAAGLPEGCSLTDGGSGAVAYADAIATYLGLAVSRIADLNNSLVTWSNSRDQARNLFARQAIPLAWDYVEVSPFGNAAGDVGIATRTMSDAISNLPATSTGHVKQADARRCAFSGTVLSTDPPYYDNVPYADLSDFFYVWLRRALREIWPDLFATLLVPKADELVADSERHHGRATAKRYFEEGFTEVFARARAEGCIDAPSAVFYAFKQSEATSDGSASSGWETLLEGMVRSRWMITATWPMRSERGVRMRAIGSNTLASAIVLALRARPENAPVLDRRGFISALHAELPIRLRELQHGAIAPVDLPQAAIGPGMAVFSRYAKVLEGDGSAMTVRSALARINEVLDQVLSEQEGDFDATTGFAIVWYRQHGYSKGSFGEADNVARARNTSVAAMERAGILTARAGKVALLAPANLRNDYDPTRDLDISAWEVLHHLIRLLESDGLRAAGQFLALVADRVDGGIDPALVKELAFLLFSIADKNKSAKDAIAFNNIVTSWSDVVELARGGSASAEPALTLDYSSEDEEV